MVADPAIDFPVRVAPAKGSEFNTVRERLLPVASWQVEDFRFEFGSSCILADAAKEFVILAEMRHEHPGASLALFGHADPTGDDTLNKTLSGRRATAVYAVLTRRTDLWGTLYDQPTGGDKWGTPALEMMCGALQRPHVDVSRRSQLFSDYMDLICRDREGSPYQLDAKHDFLARGKDPHGKSDYQGCGEFNPLVMFSHAEASRYEDKALKSERDAANAANRRVTGLLFPAGLVVDPARWPCPRATEGVDGCRKRFWSDAAGRRQFQAAHRTQDVQADTFACRFYDRIAQDVIGPNWVHLRLQLHDPMYQPCEGAEYTLTLASGTRRVGKTGPGGWLSIAVPREPQVAALVYRPKESTVEYSIDVKLAPPGTAPDEVYLAHLRNLGFVDGRGDARTVVEGFQAARGQLKLTGVLDEPTRKAIDEMLQHPLRDTFEPDDG